jgi:LacI family transcriptional regulator
MTPFRTFKVLAMLNMASTAGRQKLAGIHRFLAEGYDWNLELVRTSEECTTERITSAARDGLDGFLAAIPKTPSMHALHAKLGVPTAFIDYPDKHTLNEFPKCVFVMDDTDEICRVAAYSVLSGGIYKSYCYAESKDASRWSKERGEKFVAEMSKHNIKTIRLGSDVIANHESLAANLLKLARPAIVLAAYDDTAKTVLETCKSLGISVPNDIAVIGIGGDEDICTHTKPTLSSITPDFEGEGYRAARELQALMTGGVKTSRRVFFCKNVIFTERKSTRQTTNTATLVHDALAFISQNALRGISAQDVVRHLHVSRRLADLRFREATKTSMQQAIIKRRLSEVCRLLVSTNLPISAIALRCGYHDANYLKNQFKRTFRISMREYRRQRTLPPRNS